MTKRAQEILNEILAIDKSNLFLKYIVRRLRSKEYRGWHVSQHNRYDLHHIKSILRKIHAVAKLEQFAIPPGDYQRDTILPDDFRKYQTIVKRINAEAGRGTINSLKKNFFPDLENMGFLSREKFKLCEKGRPVLHGKLTSHAVEFITDTEVITSYKKFTDGIDRLFGNKISQLAETIHHSDYSGDKLSIYEFMFILSDSDGTLDKIGLLDSCRSLPKHNRKKVIELAREYADPRNFEGDKTAKRDFHNWKNQAQQIMRLLKTTVYFEVDKDCFRLNVGDTGFFFRENTQRKSAPKRKYFEFHEVKKKDGFELHHIVPISSARNKKEARIIDHYRNLIYIHRKKHKIISKNRNKNVVLTIGPDKALFADFDNRRCVKAINNQDALYAKEQNKVKKIATYNVKLLKSIFEFERSQ